MYESKYIDDIDNKFDANLGVKGDAISHVFYPWRRFFARSLDSFLYNLIWLVILVCAFHVNLMSRSTLIGLVDNLIVLVATLLIEPLLLRLFSTTPGKAVFGLKIELPNGMRLSYGEGLKRTWGVISTGMGYCIPIYNLVCLWKSYTLCSDRTTQPWDVNISYTIKDTRWFRGVLFGGAYVACFTLLVYIILALPAPPNRGDLTVAELAENYNYYLDYFDVDLCNQYLDETGKWAEKEHDRTVFYLYDDLPDYHYKIVNGYVTDVSFQVELNNEQNWPSLYNDQIILLSLSMVGAQKEVGFFSNVPRRIVDRVNVIDGFNMTEANMKMTCQTKHSGYYITQQEFLIPEIADAETYYSLDFSINKLP